MDLRNGIAAAAVLAWGCSSGAGPVDRESVAAGIEERTGAGIGRERPPGEVAFPPGIDIGDGIGEDEAVAIALWNNAGFQEALADLGLARAAVVEAGILRNPVFSLLFPWGPKQLEAAAKLPLESFWIAPRRVEAAALDAERVAALLVQHGLDLVRDVRAAHAGALAARARLELAGEAVRVRREIAALADRRRAAGDASALDVAEAEAEAARAEAWADARFHEAGQTHQRLLALLGLAREELTVAWTGDATAAPALPDRPGLEDLALAARPDLRAAELAVEAAGARARLAGLDAIPVTAVADANAEGTEGFEAGPGLEAAIPVFDQGQGARARAAAERERALRHVETVRQSIAAAIDEAWAAWRQAGSRIARYDGSVIAAALRVEDLARKAAAAGETTLEPLHRATARVLEVRDERIRLEAELRAARAALEHAAGRRL